jgi:uncharacterized protein
MSRAMPAPARDPGNARFLDAAREGKLLYGWSPTSGRAHFPPRRFCPFSLATDVEWREASGAGVVYSFSIARHPEPYVLAYVTLAEGPTLLTNIVGCAPEAVRIGVAVRLAFAPAEDGTPLPVFTLAQ